MVEISKSGSGEGLGGVIPRGYSKSQKVGTPTRFKMSSTLAYSDGITRPQLARTPGWTIISSSRVLCLSPRHV